MLTTFLLLVMIPAALIRDLFCAQHVLKQRSARKKFAIAALMCSCLVVFFFIDALVLEIFVEKAKHVGAKLAGDEVDAVEAFFGSVSFIATQISAQMEFLTLTGIILNAMMQGYVCANSIYVYLIEDVEKELEKYQKESFKKEFETHLNTEDIEGGTQKKDFLGNA